MNVQTLRAACVYFALVFGAGFLLALIRLPFLVPRFGVRVAELLEMPVMLVVIVLAARAIARRFSLPPTIGLRLHVGLIAFALLVAAELGLALTVQSQSLGQYLAGRDPVSGSVYLAMLGLFALMPLILACRSHGA